MTPGIRGMIAAAGLYAMAAVPAVAQDMNVRVLGWYPNQPQTEEVEKPFFNNLASRTGLGLKAQYRSLGELNLKPFEHLRTLNSGAFDIMILGSGWVSGDDPMFIGHDLPGLSFDFDGVKKVMDAWRPVLEKRIAERHNAKLLTMAPFPPQVLFCRDEVKSIADLKAKKIRVASAASSTLVEVLGGTAVTLAGPEVYGALQRGVIDCGSTGTAYANSNSWYEVSKSIYTLPIGGYSVVMHVVRNDFWNKLKPDQQSKLQAAFAELERDMTQSTRDAHDNGLRCNTGQQPCTGKRGTMTAVEPSEADRKEFGRLVEQSVLPSWGRDCERVVPDCKAQWNATVGKTLGLKM